MRVRVVDSHTGGEPTRVVLSGGPALSGTMAQRVAQLRESHDHFRTAVSCEPRGFEAVVGALLQEPTQRNCAAAVIFFDNAGYLGMCGHGTIGLVTTLAWLGRLQPGAHRIETPVGIVDVILDDEGAVTVRNVPAWVYRTQVAVTVAGLGEIHGDIVYGGNWFYIVDWRTPPSFGSVSELVDITRRIRAALEAAGITGAGGALIDHIELSGPAAAPDNHGRNFVLCPGLTYDRSPCGTGTSAKLALLAHQGKLGPQARWRQESVTGSLFEAWYEELPGDEHQAVLPRIRGRAWITAQAELVFDPTDPLRHGQRAG